MRIVSFMDNFVDYSEFEFYDIACFIFFFDVLILYIL
jgi:hypothetical protein